MRIPCTAAVAAVLLLGLSACSGKNSSSDTKCTDATTCPVPSNVCLAATCAGGQCGDAPRVAGTKISDPTPGDCKSNQCDGAGNLAAANDDTDPPSASGDCAAPTCTAGVPGEQFKAAGTACASGGGVFCDGAGVCVQCLADPDCVSGYCSAARTCQVPSCVDGVKNGTETDVDCGGGACPACPIGRSCQAGADCVNGVCSGGSCQAASCADMVKNGTETDVDCGGGACPSCATGKNCTANGDCSSGACVGNVCAAPLGAACVTNGGCGSGFCVDGVCCNTSCANGCQQCNLAGSLGTCSSSVAGTDPRDTCTAQSASSCSTTGVCNGAGACAVWPAGTACSAGSCNGGIATTPSTCDGSMSCVAGTSVSCGKYVCGATACLTSCAVPGDCAAGFTCTAGACL